MFSSKSDKEDCQSDINSESLKQSVQTCDFL